MTDFNHQPHTGGRKKRKHRKRQPIGIRSLKALRVHRELEYLRHPTEERARKLREVSG